MKPWEPITEPCDLKHLGKLGEEVCELGKSIFRTIIQGVDERDPDSQKTNRQMLQEEIADVEAGIELLKNYYNLDCEFIATRSIAKQYRLADWHNALKRPTDADQRLMILVDQAQRHFDALPPEEQEAHRYEQRRSFVRGMCPGNRDYSDWCKEVDRQLPPRTK